jgi:hypothetical protein
MSGATTQVGIVEWADRIESARALELQLAGVIGAWVPRIVPAGAKLLLARHARHFAWHAELWDGLVPVLHDRPEGSAVVDASLTGAQATLAAATEPKAVYDDVLPLVVAAYRTWSGESTPIAERPVMRVLDLVLRDIDFDAQEGHDLFARA